eukprot:4225831-Prymnesium_polylepis.3
MKRGPCSDAVRPALGWLPGGAGRGWGRDGMGGSGQGGSGSIPPTRFALNGVHLRMVLYKSASRE